MYIWNYRRNATSINRITVTVNSTIGRCGSDGASFAKFCLIGRCLTGMGGVYIKKAVIRYCPSDRPLNPSLFTHHE